MKRPVIVANGGANVASLRYALERLGVRPEVTADPRAIRLAIGPATGLSSIGMSRLSESDWSSTSTSLPTCE